MSIQRAPEDSLRMTQLLFGFTTSQALYAIAPLGVRTRSSTGRATSKTWPR